MPGPRIPRSTLCTGLLSVLLAAGWTCREATLAAAGASRVPSGTRSAAEIEMDDHVYAGVPRGKAGLYADGATPALRKLQVGRFLLSPGQEPHPPHRHVDEEVLIVSRGKGEVIVDGKTTPVTDGAVMYTDPNVEHGIKNTGDRPLEFYWIKYIPQPR